MVDRREACCLLLLIAASAFGLDGADVSPLSNQSAATQATAVGDAQIGLSSPLRPAMDPSLAERLRAALQPLIDSRSERLSSGITVAFKSSELSLSLVAGAVRRSDDPARGPSPAMSPKDRLLFGSVTKMYTATAVLRLIERGLVGLDDPAHVHLDPLLQQVNRSSLVSLFGPSATQVTVRHLLSMRSGIYDFDDDDTRAFQNAHPQIDISPWDDLSFASVRGRRTPLYRAV